MPPVLEQRVLVQIVTDQCVAGDQVALVALRTIGSHAPQTEPEF